jgi:hypothetical protein
MCIYYLYIIFDIYKIINLMIKIFLTATNYNKLYIKNLALKLFAKYNYNTNQDYITYYNYNKSSIKIV